MLGIIHLAEGIRFFKRSLKVRRKGIVRQGDTAQEICKNITERCWNGKFFQTSLGHFCQFWTRDFGWCAKSLVKLGHRAKVQKTLDYALSIFSKKGQICTTITPKGKPFDFPNFAPDSLAMMLHSLSVSDSKALIKKHWAFLQEQINSFYDIVIDKNTGLVRSDRHFSSIKDYAKRRSSCYDNCMVSMVSGYASSLGFCNPLKGYDNEKILMKNFWKETHFVDDLSGRDFITGDANIFPFWSGSIHSMEMQSKAVETIRKYGLDMPIPLRYYHQSIKEQDMLSIEAFAKNYERDTVWLHLGMLYLEMIKSLDKDLARRYADAYRNLISTCGTFPEILNEDLTLYKSPFYFSDEGMLWASIFLVLENDLS